VAVAQAKSGAGPWGSGRIKKYAKDSIAKSICTKRKTCKELKRNRMEPKARRKIEKRFGKQVMAMVKMNMRMVGKMATLRWAMAVMMTIRP